MLGDNIVTRVSEALAQSRFLVLVLSRHTDGRPWPEAEWTSFVARHHLLCQVVPVLLESVEVPTVLSALAHVDASHRDARNVAVEIAAVTGKVSDLSPGDKRALYLGQHLPFVVSRADDSLEITDPNGVKRRVNLPWNDRAFATATLSFHRATEALTGEWGVSSVHAAPKRTGAPRIDAVDCYGGKVDRSNDVRFWEWSKRCGARFCNAYSPSFAGL